MSFLRNGAWEQVVGLVDPDDPWHERADIARDWVFRDLDHVLDRLVYTGTLARAELGGEAKDEGAAVVLTPLGTWVARSVLLAQGYDVPLVGELAHGDGGALLRAIADHPPEEEQAEFRAWVEAHGSGAVEELADALRAEADPAARTMAAGVLIWLPDDAAEGVRKLSDDALLGAIARLWLVDRGLAPPSSVNQADGAQMLVDTLAAILALEGANGMVEYFRRTMPDRRTAPHSLDGLWAADSPHVDSVLQALVDAGGKDLGKAARRSLVKRRSRSRG